MREGIQDSIGPSRGDGGQTFVKRLDQPSHSWFPVNDVCNSQGSQWMQGPFCGEDVNK